MKVINKFYAFFQPKQLQPLYLKASLACPRHNQVYDCDVRFMEGKYLYCFYNRIESSEQQPSGAEYLLNISYNSFDLSLPCAIVDRWNIDPVLAPQGKLPGIKLKLGPLNFPLHWQIFKLRWKLMKNPPRFADVLGEEIDRAA